MTSRGWIIPADAESPLRVSTLFQFKKEYGCEVDFIVKDFDDFHFILFFDDRGRVKDLAQNTRAGKMARFDIVGDLFVVTENNDGFLLLPEDRIMECLS